MKRADVYRAIDSERAYQQATGKPDDRHISEWIASIFRYWWRMSQQGETSVIVALLRKIAALCVATLEQYGVEQREGYEQPGMPKPDWATAPAWAIAWAINPNGMSRWYEFRPVVYTSEDDAIWNWPDESALTRCKDAGYIELAIGLDWRQSLQLRPSGEGSNA